MAKQSQTNATTQQILRFLFEQGVFAWRQNTTGIPIRGGGMRVSGKTGVSDIICCVPPHGRLCALEIKTGKDILSDAQTGFLASIKATGGLSMVVHDFDDFLSQWQNLVENGTIKPCLIN